MAKLRVIDNGTRYDVAGSLRHLIRRIERNEMKPRDVLVVTRESIQNNASCKVVLHHFGPGTTEEIHWMLATAQNRIEPA